VLGVFLTLFKTLYFMRIFKLIVLAKLMLITASTAEVSIASESSITALAYKTQHSTTDLINAGASTLSSASVSATQSSTNFPGTGINDGNHSNTLTHNTFFSVSSPATFLATATYNLNITVNVNGYDITSIKSFMGWATFSAAQANQTYTVAFSQVGSASFTDFATVSFKPFNDTNTPTYETFVTISDEVEGTALATGVDAIRFTFTNPIGVNGVTPGTGTYEGTLIREIDVFGTPTTGAPVAPTKLVVNAVNGGLNPTAGSAFGVTVQAQDEGGTPRNVTANTAVNLSLKTGTGSLGGTLSGIITAGSHSVTISGVTYNQAEAGVVLTATQNSGDSLTAADSAPFTVDALAGSTVTITSPSPRHIVQRSSGNIGSLSVSGTYTSAPQSIEARAVVMSGAGNSGTSTEWQTIQTSPIGGTFTGTLMNVSAGGWYQLEVRAVTAGFSAPVATLEKVGVGDIYVTAGQSNSANFGGPAYTPADDRVSTRTSVSAGSWRHGSDPQPLAGGSGGSVWSRLGDQLAAADNIPIGFICVGVGSTQVSQWVPGTANYNNLLKPAIRSLGVSGCRAVLWHQGESDSLASVSASTHATRLNSMITESRIDAGWAVPWYLAQASFHNNSNLAQEEPVCAGQRSAVYGDTNVFLGPTTDAFHLEDAAGGKLSDSVHFNAAGLLDHATQWRDILRGSTTTTPRNGDFEANRNLTITGLAPLADGAPHVVSLSEKDSPSVIGWRILTADGLNAAAGNNGFHNPTTGTYAAAIDTSNGGVMPFMNGRHVAFLDGGIANNHFLHTTRATLKANTRYTLQVALGVRDIANTFGNARLDILADGVVVATASYDKSALDAIHGSDASGTFNDVALSYMTGATVTPDQTLAIRIAKVDGVSTVLDFDNVRFTAHTGFAAFQMRYWGSTTHPDSSGSLDPDNDGYTNQEEFAFGLNPISGSSVSPILAQLDKTTGQFSYQRLAASGLTYKILTSTTLASGSWTEDATATQVAGVIDGNGSQTVVVTLTGAPLGSPRLFVRVAAE